MKAKVEELVETFAELDYEDVADSLEYLAECYRRKANERTR